MTPRLIAGSAIVSLCLGSIAPAMAQDYRFAGFDPPRGATATVNLRVPLGRRSQQARPTVGFTAGFGRTIGSSSVDGLPAVRQIRFADLRFHRRGVSRAELASFDLANLDRDRRLGIDVGGSKKNSVLLYLMIIGGLTTMYFLIEGNSRGEFPKENPEPIYTPPPGG